VFVLIPVTFKDQLVVFDAETLASAMFSVSVFVVLMIIIGDM
jgi:hypothetical protein